MRKFCLVCQRFFNTEDEGAQICSVCRTEYERNRTLCRDYLKVNRGATLAEVSRATGLPTRKVRQLIEDGSLDYLNG